MNKAEEVSHLKDRLKQIPEMPETWQERVNITVKLAEIQGMDEEEFRRRMTNGR